MTTVDVHSERNRTLASILSARKRTNVDDQLNKHGRENGWRKDFISERRMKTLLEDTRQVDQSDAPPGEPLSD